MVRQSLDLFLEVIRQLWAIATQFICGDAPAVLRSPPTQRRTTSRFSRELSGIGFVSWISNGPGLSRPGFARVHEPQESCETPLRVKGVPGIPRLIFGPWLSSFPLECSPESALGSHSSPCPPS